MLIPKNTIPNGSNSRLDQLGLEIFKKIFFRKISEIYFLPNGDFVSSFASQSLPLTCNYRLLALAKARAGGLLTIAFYQLEG